MSTMEEFAGLRERVAVMESRMKAMEDYQNRQTALMETMTHTLSALHRRFDKQYSFIGGIVFVVTGIWAVIQFISHFFWKT